MLAQLQNILSPFVQNFSNNIKHAFGESGARAVSYLNENKVAGGCLLMIINSVQIKSMAFLAETYKRNALKKSQIYVSLYDPLLALSAGSSTFIFNEFFKRITGIKMLRITNLFISILSTAYVWTKLKNIILSNELFKQTEVKNKNKVEVIEEKIPNEDLSSDDQKTSPPHVNNKKETHPTVDSDEDEDWKPYGDPSVDGLRIQFDDAIFYNDEFEEFFTTLYPGILSIIQKDLEPISQLFVKFPQFSTWEYYYVEAYKMRILQIKVCKKHIEELQKQTSQNIPQKIEIKMDDIEYTNISDLIMVPCRMDNLTQSKDFKDQLVTLFEKIEKKHFILRTQLKGLKEALITK